MTKPDINKAQYTQESMARRIAGYLDAKDGTPDDKISKEEWNLFADYSGIEGTELDFVKVDDAVANIDTLMTKNPEKVVNYTRKYLGKKIKVHVDTPENVDNILSKDESAEKQFLAMFTLNIVNTINPIAGAVYSLARNSKKISDGLLSYYIKYADSSNIQKGIRLAAKISSEDFPLASKLLRMSVTPSEMSPGAHGDYYVLNKNQGKEKLAGLGMHEGDVTIVGNDNDHLTTSKMQLNTAVFNNKSEASKVINESSIVKQTAKLWYAEGKPKKKYYSGVLNETSDLLLGINSCLISVVNSVDNGQSVTFSGYVEDIYDFSKNYSQTNSTIKTDIIDTINRAAYNAQEKGAIKPYRVLIPFEVTLPKKKQNNRM